MRIDDYNLRLFQIDIAEDIPDGDSISIDNVGTYQPLLIKRRRVLVKPYKDIRKSQSAKAGWRSSRYSHLKGIRDFAKSVEGKRFHRNLANFIVRKGYTIGAGSKLESIDRFEAAELAKLLSSYKTHMLIELEAYKSLTEEVDFFNVAESAFDFLDKNISSLIECVFSYSDFTITEEFYDTLIRILEPAGVIHSFALQTGKSDDEVEKLWNKAKEIVSKEYNKSEEDPSYYASVTGLLKKMLGINSEDVNG